MFLIEIGIKVAAVSVKFQSLFYLDNVSYLIMIYIIILIKEFQSLFYLDNVSYFSLQNTLIKNDCFNPYFIWTMFLMKQL